MMMRLRCGGICVAAGGHDGNVMVAATSSARHATTAGSRGVDVIVVSRQLAVLTTRRFIRRLASLTRISLRARGGQEMTVENTFAVNCALALKQVTSWAA